MANKIGRILLGIVLLVAAVVVVYMVLPGSIKFPLKAKLQDSTDDNYAVIVNAIKATTVPKHKKITFEEMMNVTDGPAWTIEKISVDDAGNGMYDVFCDGYKTTVQYDNDQADNLVTHTNAHVRIVFHINKKGNEITIGKDEVEAGKVSYPGEVKVDEYEFKRTDESSYYQGTLDCLCGMTGK